MTIKKNISKIYFLFLLSHLILWTLIPYISNINLPLDTIEALAWGSNLEWGFNKHPPFSAFAVQLFYLIFESNDWAYYFLSQLFVITAFIYIWKLSNEILNDKFNALCSLLILESIFFYNFTTPEFNVNVSQLPFWALTGYFFWKGVNENKTFHWLLFGVFSAIGFLSKYIFIYVLLSYFFYFIFYIRKDTKKLKNYIFSILVSLLILTPHFLWLIQNEFITIFYGITRSSISSIGLINHIINPIEFILKQLCILIPFFFMIFILLKKFKFKVNFKRKKSIFIFSITLLPIIFIFITSLITGAKIRTMWMTPFYLFFGILFFEIIKNNIEYKRIKFFFSTFIFLFILSPMTYLGISIFDDSKRTDYPGKEISRLVQDKWDENFVNDIKIVIGDEWSAGNLSYHLPSRPIWINDLKGKVSDLSENQGVVYTGNPKILKEICPGVYGTIKPVGYCMIGKK